MNALPHLVQSEHDDSWVVGLVGEFDIAATDLLRSTLRAAISAGRSKLVVDLSGTTFLDSTALGLIVGVAKRASDCGGWLRLVAPQPNVRKILRITEIDTVLGLYDTIEQAADHVESPTGASPVVPIPS